MRSAPVSLIPPRSLDSIPQPSLASGGTFHSFPTFPSVISLGALVFPSFWEEGASSPILPYGAPQHVPSFLSFPSDCPSFRSAPSLVSGGGLLF